MDDTSKINDKLKNAGKHISSMNQADQDTSLIDKAHGDTLLNETTEANISLIDVECENTIFGDNTDGNLYIIQPPTDIFQETENLKLKAIVDLFKIHDSQLTDIKKSFEYAFNHGLNNQNDPFHYPPVKMVNTYLWVVPNGKETGEFVALDLGGTNLRVLAISIEDKKLCTQARSYEVPVNVQTGIAIELFDYIAEKIEIGLREFNLLDIKIKLMGFTFSFAVKQMDLNKGELISWSKGYSVKDVVGKDVVRLLREACQKRQLKIEDFVLINDTTGTLLCGAFEDASTMIGVINGTGTNACYLEQVSNIPNWQGSTEFSSVIINTEWGAYGENGELDQHTTIFDRNVDRDSTNPGYHIFEKMVSGMYIGRLVREIILSCAKQNIIFSGEVPGLMKDDQDGIKAKLISNIYSKEKCKAYLMDTYNYEISEEDYKTLYQICDAISERACMLFAAALSALSERIPGNECTIAADGSVLKKHPRFIQRVEHHLSILSPNKTYKFLLVSDGSGKGAALAACVAGKEIRKSSDSKNIQ